MPPDMYSARVRLYDRSLALASVGGRRRGHLDGLLLCGDELGQPGFGSVVLFARLLGPKLELGDLGLELVRPCFWRPSSGSA